MTGVQTCALPIFERIEGRRGGYGRDEEEERRVRKWRGRRRKRQERKVEEEGE